VSNGRTFRPVSVATSKRAKARRYRGPMGRVRAAALTLNGPRRLDPAPWDPAPWDTGTGLGLNGRNTYARGQEDARRRERGPNPITAHARRPRSARKPPAPVADGTRAVWTAAEVTHRGIGLLGRRTR
jgi:hypothetical protein